MAKRKPILLIDQDDVLANFIEGLLYEHNKIHKTNFKPEECISWDLSSVFGQDILNTMKKPYFFRNLEPIYDSIEGFKRIYKENKYDMYIVSAVYDFAYADKVYWIKKYLPFFPIERFIAAYHKELIIGDILLDDKINNIERFKKMGIGEPIIFDCWHNKNYTGSKRVYNFMEFEDYLNFKFENKKKYMSI